MSMKAPKQIEFDIGSRKFMTNKWGPTKVYLNMPKIGKYFAVPLSIFYGGASSGDFSEAIPSAVIYLFQQMEESQITDLFNVILKDTYTATGGQSVVDCFDEVFEEDPQEVLEIVAKVLEVNYGSFFKKGGFESLLKIVAPMAQAEDLYQ